MDELNKGKRRTRRRVRDLERLHRDSVHPSPGHVDGLAIAEGYCDAQNNDDVARADEFKMTSHAVPGVTSDIGQRYQPDESHPAPRDPSGNPRQDAPRRGKKTRVVGAEAAIPTGSSDGRYADQARAAARAGDVGSMHVPQPGEDPASVKASLGTPSASPLSRALAYMEEQRKSAAQQAAGRGNPASVPDYASQRDGRNSGRTAVGAEDLDQQGGLSGREARGPAERRSPHRERQRRRSEPGAVRPRRLYSPGDCASRDVHPQERRGLLRRHEPGGALPAASGGSS